MQVRAIPCLGRHIQPILITSRSVTENRLVPLQSHALELMSERTPNDSALRWHRHVGSSGDFGAAGTKVKHLVGEYQM